MGLFGLTRKEKETWTSIVIQGLKPGMQIDDVLLKNAGWGVKEGKRVNDKTGEVFSFEILLQDPKEEKISCLEINL